MELKQCSILGENREVAPSPYPFRLEKPSRIFKEQRPGTPTETAKDGYWQEWSIAIPDNYSHPPLIYRIILNSNGPGVQLWFDYSTPLQIQHDGPGSRRNSVSNGSTGTTTEPSANL